MKSTHSRLTFGRNERGAMLVHVAVALLTITALSTFAVDYGLFYLSRREAQNSADAAALAGVIALTYDSPSQANNGMAKQSAYKVSQTNLVWGEAPAVNIASDITFPACPDGTSPCVRVDVYRNAAHGNALPVIFGGLVGLGDQGIRATATAQALASNASYCLKPWIIPDKWEEHYPLNPGTWSLNSLFETSVKVKGKDVPVANPDVYRPPTSDNTTGFRAEGTPNDIGRELILKAPQPSGQTPGGAVGPGWVYPVRLDEDAPGGNVYMNDIQHCSNKLVKIGDLLRNETGIMVGPTFHGVDPLIAADKNAQWYDPDGPGLEPGKVIHSCQDTATCSTEYSESPGKSPRLIDVPVFNPATFSQDPGAQYLEVVNIMGMFLLERNGNEIRGVITGYKGTYAAGGDPVDDAATFSYTISLVR